MFELVVRVVLSLGVVLGLFWFVARASSRRLGGGGQRSLVKVRSRQSLTRTSSLAVVEVGSRVLVLGVSDGGVRLLTEMDPDELEPVVVVPAQAVLETSAEEVSGSWEESEAFAAAYEAAYLSTSTEPAEPTEPTDISAEAAAAHAARSAGALRGSLLDGGVWRDAWASATGRGRGDAA